MKPAARLHSSYGAGEDRPLPEMNELIDNGIASRYVRNYYRMNLFIDSYYHFLTTGRAQNAYP